MAAALNRGFLRHLVRVAGRWYDYLTDSWRRAHLRRIGWVLVPMVGGGTGFGTPIVGAQSTVTVATVTPVWGATTQAGSVVFGFVLANNTGAVTGPSGWTAITANNTSQFTLWYKLSAAAGEANPTFTSASATVMKAYLVEVPVTGGTVTADKNGLNTTATASPCATTASAPDTAATDLVMVGTAWRNSSATTGTISYTAGFTNLLNDGSASSTAHIGGCFQVLTSGGSTADTCSTSYTGAVSRVAGVIASFKFTATAVQVYPPILQTGQAVTRASIW